MEGTDGYVSHRESAFDTAVMVEANSQDYLTYNHSIQALSVPTSLSGGIFMCSGYYFKNGNQYTEFSDKTTLIVSGM